MLALAAERTIECIFFLARHPVLLSFSTRSPTHVIVRQVRHTCDPAGNLIHAQYDL
jgi:hypothetical protein